MRRLLSLIAFAPLFALQPSRAAEPDTRVYEMRVYYAAPGKLDALNARFRDHTMKLFEKHGITNVGYFVPIDNKDNKLVYLISATRARTPATSRGRRSRPTRTGRRPPPRARRTAARRQGRLDLPDRDRLLAGAQDPHKRRTSRVFELRTYTATKGNLGNLNDRFKDHTMKLFEKHGMTNVVYWNVLKGQKDDDKRLVYLLAHKSQDAAKKSFDAFRKDPDWMAAQGRQREEGRRLA